MKYINAQQILPEALIKELQKYILVCENHYHHWGELSGYREE